MVERQRFGLSGLAVWTLSTLLGCTGTIEPPAEARRDPRGVRGEGGGASSASPPSVEEFHPAPTTLRRLTVAQYRNSVRDLLGDAVTIAADLEADTTLNGFASIGAARVALSPHATEQFEASALSIAHQAMSDAARRGALVGCAPASVTDETCARQFITRFGRRAFRRPIEDTEVTRYATIATQASDALGDFYEGLEYGLATILQSPRFLYREEIGSPDPSNTSRRVFDGYEVATRLSFFLWNSTPDDTLLDAAAAGLLGTDEGLLGQARRLLEAPRARDAVASFFGELLHLEDLDDLPQLPDLFPAVSATIGPSMRGETQRAVDDIVFARDADFRELFDTRTTFVNAELAKLYGLAVPAGTDFAKVVLPETGMRAGLLGQASFLARNAHANMTSPTRRGKFIREVLLCQAIPPPPPNVDTKLPEDPQGQTPRTMRQKLEQHRANAACAGCHTLMDPIGLGLENFDAIGAYRATEGGIAIDASGDLDGVPFANARDLARLLKEDPGAAACLARSVFRYASGHVETAGEEPLIDALVSEMPGNGFRFRSLLLSIITSPGFRYGGNPA